MFRDGLCYFTSVNDTPLSHCIHVLRDNKRKEKGEDPPFSFSPVHLYHRIAARQ